MVLFVLYLVLKPDIKPIKFWFEVRISFCLCLLLILQVLILLIIYVFICFLRFTAKASTFLISCILKIHFLNL